MKVNILSLDGEKSGEIEMPDVFGGEVRPDLILRAVRAEMSKQYQPKGAYRWAGLQTSADYIGNKDAYRTMKNRGQAMLPHEKLPKGRIGRVRRIPFAVTGRRAHPPKPEKILVEKINRKEYRKALLSAISASASQESVKLRTGAEYKVPYILVDDIEQVSKAKELLKVLKSLGIAVEVSKSSQGRKRVTGFRRKRLNRAYKVRKSILFVVSKDCPLVKSGSGIPGASVVKADKIKVGDLAPGGLPGRIVVWSSSAVSMVG